MNVINYLGARRLARNVEEMNGKQPNIFFIVCWYFISPIFIFVSILTAIHIFVESIIFFDWGKIVFLLKIHFKDCIHVYRTVFILFNIYIDDSTLLKIHKKWYTTKADELTLFPKNGISSSICYKFILQGNVTRNLSLLEYIQVDLYIWCSYY